MWELRAEKEQSKGACEAEGHSGAAWHCRKQVRPGPQHSVGNEASQGTEEQGW